MMRINLLPHREEKRRARRQQFYALLGLVTVLSGLIVFLVYSVIGGYISAQDARNDFLKKEITLLDKQIDQIKRLKEQSDALMERKRIIESLQRDRAEAVRLLSELAKQMPEGRVPPVAEAGRTADQPLRTRPVERAGVHADAQHRSITVAGKAAVTRNQGRDGRQAASQRVQHECVAQESCRGERRAEVKAPVLPSIDFRAILRDFQNLNPKDVGAWPVVPRVSVLVGRAAADPARRLVPGVG
jgi:hypothetical protein